MALNNQPDNELENKPDLIAKAKAYHTAVSHYDVASVEKMVREDYIQHNPRVPTGRAAFLALLPNLQKHNTKIKNIRIFQDGRHVIMHHLWQNAIPFGANEKVAFHIIRFDNEELIAEHWSVMTDYKALNTSTRTLIDGVTEITDLENTDKNKKIIIELFGRLIKTKSQDSTKIASPFFPGEIIYSRQHKVFGSGNFVLSISEGTYQKKITVFYDLFRLENGRVCEHWPVYQDIPTEGLANNNTMFGFAD